jgi:hypothetical protein
MRAPAAELFYRLETPGDAPLCVNFDSIAGGSAAIHKGEMSLVVSMAELDALIERRESFRRVLSEIENPTPKGEPNVPPR